MNIKTAKPKANPKASITIGNCRFTILTPRIIRMEWAPKALFEDRASFVFINRDLPVPAFSYKETGNHVSITTPYFNLHYKASSSRFTADNLSIRIKNNRNWTPGVKDPLNLKGTTRTLDNHNGGKRVVLEDGLLSRSGWTFIDDSSSFLFNDSSWPWVEQRQETPFQDWYFFAYDKDYLAILKDFTQISGSIPLPPKFAFGYWWSRYWAYSDSEIRELVNDFDEFNIPLDVFIIDMDWHKTYGFHSANIKKDPFGEWIGWTGYTWNENLFPQPKKLLSFLKGKKIKTSLNLHPASGIPPMEEHYEDFAEEYGTDSEEKDYIPYLLSEKKWAEAYFNQIIKPLEDDGVDFWWLDWQQFPTSKRIKGLNNTWWLNYAFTSWARRRGKRPLIFHRWGGLGNHRYQIGFSGDAYSTWETLEYQIYFTATAANVCYGYWSHDIGGHIPVDDDTDEELYLRWLQFGALSPILRTHSTKSSKMERRIWKFPNSFSLMKSAILFRYELIPYIYMNAKKAEKSGVSLCRPLYYHYPNEEEAYHAEGQYFFGDDMIAAPITSPVDDQTGLREKKIWLPEGEWFDYFRGEILEGNQTLSIKYSLAEIPLFIKQGAIIPYSFRERESSQNELGVMIIPGSQKGKLLFYDDDGVSLPENDMNRTIIPISYERSKNTMLVSIGSNQGDSEEHIDKTYQIKIPRAFPPTKATLDKIKVAAAETKNAEGWFYDASSLSLHITTPFLSSNKNHLIEISFNDENAELLNGKKLFFNRLKSQIYTLKMAASREHWGCSIPEPLNFAAETPTRIQYAPSRCAEILTELDESIPQILESLVCIPHVDAHEIKRFIAAMELGSLLSEPPKLPCSEFLSPDNAIVKIEGPNPEECRYTLDGSRPKKNSRRLSGEITLDRSLLLTVRRFTPGQVGSLPQSVPYYKITAQSISLKHPLTFPKKEMNSPFRLINGETGSADSIYKAWSGIEKQDLHCDLVFFRNKQPDYFILRFLNSPLFQILHPSKIKISVISDNNLKKLIFSKNFDSPEYSENAQIIEHKINLPRIPFKNLLIEAKNRKVVPDEHPLAGRPAWIFTDEIMFHTEEEKC